MENIIEENVIEDPDANPDRIVFTQEERQEFEQYFHELMRLNGYSNNLQRPNCELQFINKLLYHEIVIHNTYHVIVNENHFFRENKKYTDLTELFTQFGQFHILDNMNFDQNRLTDTIHFHFVFYRDTFDNWLHNYRENRDRIQVLK